MFNVLIDTCVWLDLADKPQQTALMAPLEGLLSYGGINLLVPRIVLEEFKSNRGRVAEKSNKGLNTHLNLVKDAVRRSKDDKRKKDRILAYLGDLGRKGAEVGGSAKATLDRIQEILEAFPIIESSDAAKIKAADRALQRKGPCHQDKNSMADALIIETYFETVKAGAPRERFAFVTHNKHDFGAVAGDDRLPHGDIASGFSKIRSMYFTNLSSCLHKINPEFVSEILYMDSFEEEPRPLSEVMWWIDRLTTQVWHNRHKGREYRIDQGQTKIVTRAEWDATSGRNTGDMIVDEIWRGALKAAKRAEKELGTDNIGPYSDFEWGMISGKLSALRWAMGDDWDNLDT
jgi:hypothetical protein